MDRKEERVTKEYVQALEVLKKKFPALGFDEAKLNPIEKRLFANRKGELFKKLEKYRILKVYGSGTNSVVLKASRGGNISAIRIGTEKWTPDKEYLRQTLESYKMAPEVELIVGVTGAPSLTLSVEGVIAEDFKTFLEKKPNERMTESALKCLLDKKYVLGMLHGDMHLENMAILEDGLTLGFIDFEFSELGLESIFTIPDFVPLLGSIKYFGKGTFLIPYILKYYKDTFNMDINMSKVKAWSRGGYIYDGALISYKALNPNWERETRAKLAKMFPKLTLPKIIEKPKGRGASSEPRASHRL
jgi:hypothetical protein